jgi:hypothetical protein
MTKNTVLSPPIPAFQNVPIASQFYQPGLFFISAIGLGTTTTITTSVNHNYTLGQSVRLIIPRIFGSRGLNGQIGNVISIPAANQVILDISSIGIDPFILSSATTKAQILAIGDVNNGFINISGLSNQTTFILGSFINISPL